MSPFLTMILFAAPVAAVSCGAWVMGKEAGREEARVLSVAAEEAGLADLLKKSLEIEELKSDLSRLEQDLVLATAPVVLPPEEERYTDAMLCHAMNFYHEARDQPAEGNLMVAQVVENRIGMREAWTDACSVIFAKGQFSWTSEKPYIDLSDPVERNAFRKALATAERVASGRVELGDEGVTHYYNPDKADPSWKEAFVRVSIVGDHAFYR